VIVWPAGLQPIFRSSPVSLSFTRTLAGELLDPLTDPVQAGQRDSIME